MAFLLYNYLLYSSSNKLLLATGLVDLYTFFPHAKMTLKEFKNLEVYLWLGKSLGFVPQDLDVKSSEKKQLYLNIVHSFSGCAMILMYLQTD